MEGLKYDFQNLGINGKFFQIVDSMYASTKVVLSYEDKEVSKRSFKTTKGLKQGGILCIIYIYIYVCVSVFCVYDVLRDLVPKRK